MKSFILAFDWSIVRVGLIFLGMGTFTVIIETIVMLLFKFDRFSKSVVDSLMANIGSLLLTILLVLIFNKREFDITQKSELLILYCIISLFEGWLIKLLNRGMSWRRIIVTSFIMNFLSFLGLYLIFTQFLAKFFAD